MAVKKVKNEKYKIGSRCDLKKKNGLSSSSLRIYILAFLIFGIGVIIILRLYFLQVVSYASYKALADEQHSVFEKLVPKRGQIYLRDRDEIYPVAVNRDAQMAYTVPQEIDDVSGTAIKVANILGLDTNETLAKLNQPDDMYEVLKHKLSDDEINQITQAKLKGIYLTDESYRYYPAGELASHVLGFVGWKDNEFGGQYGVERYMDDELRGTEGYISQEKDNAGRWIALGQNNIVNAKDGDDLVLTIDHSVQFETEKILASAVAKYQADRGTIIVMESSTGKILALASYPDFNPNDYGSVDNMEAFRDLALSDAYEPGSVFKTITMSASIDAGKISPDTTYYDSGEVQEAGYTIKNSDLKSYGNQTMTQVLERSLNTGAIFAEKALGNQNFYDYLKRFGFGTPTGIQIFGEAPGNISNLLNFNRNIQFYTSAFGQGLTVTPIQLISAYNAIANGGVLLQPQIIDHIVHPDGSVEEIQPEAVRRVISTQTAYEVGQMLRSVVTDGHGKMADVPGYVVGGKTGTAQVASTESKGYEQGKTIGSFAGYAPVVNPKFTVLVRMDNPKTVQWAESSAAPTFGELMKFLLDWSNVPPTEKYTQANIDAWNATHTLSSSFVTDNGSSAPSANSVTITNTNNSGDKDKKK